MPDVPFGCHFRRAVDLSHREPYTETDVSVRGTERTRLPCFARGTDVSERSDAAI